VTGRCQGLFPPFPFSGGKSPGNEVVMQAHGKASPCGHTSDHENYFNDALTQD